MNEAIVTQSWPKFWFVTVNCPDISTNFLQRFKADREYIFDGLLNLSRRSYKCLPRLIYTEIAKEQNIIKDDMLFCSNKKPCLINDTFHLIFVTKW